MLFKKAFGFALTLTFIQISFGLLFSGGHGLSERYFKLMNWDSAHYISIARHGYSYPTGRKVTEDDIHGGRANLMFFPGYPISGSLIHKATGLSIETSLLLLAQISAILTWLYFILILSERGVSRSGVYWSCLAVLVYPSSFFMIAAYTESFFLMGALGFIYWCDAWIRKQSIARWWIALFHGWALGLTRIVGFAVVVYPVVLGLLGKKIRVSSIVLWVLSMLGSILFFAYCQIKFRDWAAFFKLQRIGWQNENKYFAIFNPLTYFPHFFFEHTVDSISRSAVTLCAVLFFCLGYSEWILFQKKQKLEKIRIARFLVALAMFYIALTGKANSNLDSMSRYTLPVYMLLVLNCAEINQVFRSLEGEPRFFSGPGRRWKIGISLILAISIQLWFIYRFTHGKWVA